MHDKVLLTHPYALKVTARVESTLSYKTLLKKMHILLFNYQSSLIPTNMLQQNDALLLFNGRKFHVITIKYT